MVCIDLGINIPSTIFDFHFFNFLSSHLLYALFAMQSLMNFGFTIVFFLLIFSFLCFVFFSLIFPRSELHSIFKCFSTTYKLWSFVFCLFGPTWLWSNIFLWFNWNSKNDHPCGRMGDKPWANVDVGSWTCTFTRQWDAWKYTKKN